MQFDPIHKKVDPWHSAPFNPDEVGEASPTLYDGIFTEKAFKILEADRDALEHRAASAERELAKTKQDDADLAEALHIKYCEDLIEDGTPWEVAAEPEPRYFETLKEAIVFLVNLPDAAERSRDD